MAPPTVAFGPLTQLSADEMADALLQHQFFPNAKDPGEELPPLFYSSALTRPIARKLELLNIGTGRAAARSSDFVIFRSRRFDGLVRRMGLPHPVTYSRLVLHLHKHWSDLAPKLNSPESMIKPSIKGDDPRVIVMDYGSPTSKAVRLTRSAQSKRYVLKADISNCFPSLYTHALDWALRGFSNAKKDLSGNTWEARLDKYVQACHNQETKGVMIGPAVSNILAELILQRIDQQLRDSNYEFTRYIDDYTAFFRTRDEAEQFITTLDRGLSQYRLILNSRKTVIRSLREGFGEPWINDIQSHLPTGRGAVAALRFLQHCELLAHRFPDQSVLRYGVKTLLSRRQCPQIGIKPDRMARRSDVAILDELVRINYFHPHLSCFVARQLSFTSPLLTSEDRDRLAIAMREQMVEAARRSETDTVLWALYSIRKLLRRPIPVAELKQLVDIDDDLIWIAVADASAHGKRHVVARVKALDANDKGTCEQHWLSRYELYRTRHLNAADLHSENERPWFQAARQMAVSFSVLN